MFCCPCSDREYEICCKPLIERKSNPSSPEQLMRSRYSAFVLNKPEYLYDTSSVNLKSQLTVEQLRQSCIENCFVKLEIVNTETQFVEFKAFFIEHEHCGVLHERSKFVVENGIWKYDTGTLFDEPINKLNRNDLCPCDSGKKFKKCHMR
ncbi:MULTISPECIES: YchJ family protein [unclassified Psychrosphaera]|uniref:YchJ family protein n=1 Tax=unclassified Psychrosphaera TaxID=2641570 RepID=UPI002112C6F8|nr:MULTISPECIES: YchJ family metal-binding protein [unclassified Psychrosphaera]